MRFKLTPLTVDSNAGPESREEEDNPAPPPVAASAATAGVAAAVATALNQRPIVNCQLPLELPSRNQSRHDA